MGRGAAVSYRYLVANLARSSMDCSERLGVMEHSSDGFVIAEKDLEIRGPGEFLGTRQSGLPELAVANLARDGDLLAAAQERPIPPIRTKWLMPAAIESSALR